jgi:hypothetical protein
MHIQKVIKEAAKQDRAVRGSTWPDGAYLYHGMDNLMRREDGSRFVLSIASLLADDYVLSDEAGYHGTRRCRPGIEVPDGYRIMDTAVETWQDGAGILWWCNMISEWLNDTNGSAWTLFPRCIPVAPKPWWLDMATMKVTAAAEQPTKSSVRVTAEYAEYLRTMPPDEPWGLRRVMKGDTFFSYCSDWTGASSADMLDFGPSDRGIRWCRPGAEAPTPPTGYRIMNTAIETWQARSGVKWFSKNAQQWFDDTNGSEWLGYPRCIPVAPHAPKMVWREVEVCLEETRQMYLFDHPETGAPVYLANASSVPGYGGTLYDDNTLRWLFDVSLGSAGGDGEVFMRPMKVRFLRPAAPATA